MSLSPETAANGQVVTATETVTNTSSAKQNVALTCTVTTPDGHTLSRSDTVVLKPGQTSTQSQAYTVAPSDPRGIYTLRLDASNRNGTSSATATVTYV